MNSSLGRSHPITRRRLLLDAALGGLALMGGGRLTLASHDTRGWTMKQIRTGTLRYIESMRLPAEPYGRYRYAAGMPKPTLYSSTYAAMTRDLYRDLGSLSDAERAEWIEYLQSHQDDDGLFRDPLISDQGWYKGDPEWCGRRRANRRVPCSAYKTRRERDLFPDSWTRGQASGAQLLPGGTRSEVANGNPAGDRLAAAP